MPWEPKAKPSKGKPYTFGEKKKKESEARKRKQRREGQSPGDG